MSKLSYVHTPPQQPFRYTTINALIQTLAEEKPNQEQYIHRHIDGSRTSLTNNDVFANATSIAKYLTSLGVKQGDKVGILGPNSLQWIVSVFGILLCGGVAVHLSNSTKNASDILEIMQASQCRSLFIDVENNQHFINLINTLTSPAIEVKMDENHVLLMNTTSIPQLKQYSTVERIITNDTVSSIVLPQVYPEDIAMVFTTSGSTGKPKLVAHSNRSLTMVEAYIESSTEQHKKMFNGTPFSWGGGTIVDPYLLYIPRVFVDSSISKDTNNCEFIWDLICEEKCDIAVLAPYCIWDILSKFKNKELINYKVKTIATTGQIIPSSFTEVIGSICEDLQISYASTEDYSISIRHVKSRDEIFLFGDVGFTTAGVELLIVDEKGYPASLGTVGSIQVRTPSMFTEYLNDPVATKQAFTSNGWYITGDLGKLTDDGRVFILGRQKDVISRGTRKILPGLIEDIVNQLTMAVKSVAVIGVPDERLYEEVCVCFVPVEGSVGSIEAVRSFCEKNLTSNHEAMNGLGTMPTYFLEFKKFPLLSSGKTDKLALRKEAECRLF